MRFEFSLTLFTGLMENTFTAHSKQRTARLITVRQVAPH